MTADMRQVVAALREGKFYFDPIAADYVEATFPLWDAWTASGSDKSFTDWCAEVVAMVNSAAEGTWKCCPHCADDQPHIEADTHTLPCTLCRIGAPR